MGGRAVKKIPVGLMYEFSPFVRWLHWVYLQIIGKRQLSFRAAGFQPIRTRSDHHKSTNLPANSRCTPGCIFLKFPVIFSRFRLYTVNF